MADRFPAFINRILGHEGGYVNDPQDPGGETNWGISKRSYPGEDIKNLTLDQAAAIYRRDYWDMARAGDLPGRERAVRSRRRRDPAGEGAGER